MEVLKLENVKKYYGVKTNITKAVDGISFKVEEGEFVAIMGASGSGKTTLLNCISTIDSVTSGHIIVGNKDITEIKEDAMADFRKENLGFIFQDFNLLDTLSIEENISLSLIINKEDVNKVDDKVNDIAVKLGISEVLKKFPYEVSGGQKQRCACARALINHPKLILADEPTGALDSKSSRMLLETMKDTNEKLKATILMVTHDSFSASFCKRVLFLKKGKIFNEIVRGKKTRKEFFSKLLMENQRYNGGINAIKYCKDFDNPISNLQLTINKLNELKDRVDSEETKDRITTLLKVLEEELDRLIGIKNGYIDISLNRYDYLTLEDLNGQTRKLTK